MRERPAQAKSDGDGAPEPTEALATLVEKLRAELSGVRTAMRNRAVIEQAKGILMERHSIDEMVAFELLRRQSQEQNLKLRVLASQLVYQVRSTRSAAM